jgi:hypothetical protein
MLTFFGINPAQPVSLIELLLIVAGIAAIIAITVIF